MKNVHAIFENFYTIRLLFSGIHEVCHKEIDNAFFDRNIPSYSTDRKNLKKDRDAIASDLKKAVKEKETELAA
jgi:hypothetical protein